MLLEEAVVLLVALFERRREKGLRVLKDAMELRRWSEVRRESDEGGAASLEPLLRDGIFHQTRVGWSRYITLERRD